MGRKSGRYLPLTEQSWSEPLPEYRTLGCVDDIRKGSKGLDTVATETNK